MLSKKSLGAIEVSAISLMISVNRRIRMLSQEYTLQRFEEHGVAFLDCKIVEQDEGRAAGVRAGER